VKGHAHLGRAQSRAGDSLRSQRHDTLRDALMDPLTRITRITRREKNNSSNSDNSCQKPEDLWALKDVSFEACPERSRRIKQGKVVGTLAPALPLRFASGTPFGRNGAGKSTLLKILSRITEPTSSRAETCPFTLFRASSERSRRIHGRVA
jgi:lipopolysaccharide transport system ATP-binding protein